MEYLLGTFTAYLTVKKAGSSYFSIIYIITVDWCLDIFLGKNIK